MPAKYDEATKAKAVRLVVDRRDDYDSEWAAMKAVSAGSGMTAETLRKWVRQAEVDAGETEGVTTVIGETYSRRERRSLGEIAEPVGTACIRSPHSGTGYTRQCRLAGGLSPPGHHGSGRPPISVTASDCDPSNRSTGIDAISNSAPGFGSSKKNHRTSSAIRYPWARTWMSPRCPCLGARLTEYSPTPGHGATVGDNGVVIPAPADGSGPNLGQPPGDSSTTASGTETIEYRCSGPSSFSAPTEKTMSSSSTPYESEKTRISLPERSFST